MNIFDNVDIEFFSLKDQQPKDQENIVIVLKTGVDSGNPRPYRYGKPTDPILYTVKETLDFATYFTFKTRENVFRTKTAYRRRQFTAKDVICWGRLV